VTLAATASAGSSAVVVVLMLGLIACLLVALVARRHAPVRRRSRGNPAVTVAIGVVMVLVAAGALGYGVIRSLDASKAGSLPQCSSYAAATAACRIDTTAAVQRRYTTVSTGRSSTTHYRVDLVLDAPVPIAVTTELAARGCWAAMAPGARYPVRLLGRDVTDITAGVTDCRTTSHPAQQAETAFIVAGITALMGLLLIWSGMHARRTLQRLGPRLEAYAAYRQGGDTDSRRTMPPLR
jgi:hypothetical protein